MFRIPRLPWDEFFMLHAHLAATRSTCDRGPELLFDPGRHGVGAVITVDNRIIAGGYNGSPPGEPHCDEYRCPECEWEADRAEVELIAAAPNLEVRPRDDGPPLCPECGAKLVGGHLMSGGHCVRTLHAEENALLQCALDGVSPKGGTVYTTASACWDCSKRFLRVGISRVVFAEDYGSRYGLSEEACKLLRRAGVELAQLGVERLKGRLL